MHYTLYFGGSKQVEDLSFLEVSEGIFFSMRRRLDYVPGEVRVSVVWEKSLFFFLSLKKSAE